MPVAIQNASLARFTRTSAVPAATGLGTPRAPSKQDERRVLNAETGGDEEDHHAEERAQRIHGQDRAERQRETEAANDEEGLGPLHQPLQEERDEDGALGAPPRREEGGGGGVDLLEAPLPPSTQRRSRAEGTRCSARARRLASPAWRKSAKSPSPARSHRQGRDGGHPRRQRSGVLRLSRTSAAAQAAAMAR